MNWGWEIQSYEAIGVETGTNNNQWYATTGDWIVKPNVDNTYHLFVNRHMIYNFHLK